MERVNRDGELLLICPFVPQEVASAQHFFHFSLAQKMHEEELQRGFMKKRKKLKKIKFKKLIHGMKQTQLQGNEDSSKDKIYPDFLNLDSKNSEEVKNADCGHEPYEI